MDLQKSSHDQSQWKFYPSSRYTLGVEVELQILDGNSLDLLPLAPKLIAHAPELLKPRLSEELIRSILEVKSGAHFSIIDVDYDLQQSVALAEELAASNGALLCCSSLHPFASVDSQVTSNNARYLRLMDELQLVGRQFISQGLHVHVGVESGDVAVRVLTDIQPYLPLLLALSCSSPFFQGKDTGFGSYRTMLFELLPLSGIYPPLESWDAFTGMVDRLRRQQVIESVNDLWWDARLNPGFGTVEVRICDLPATFSGVLGLAALIQCLVATLAEGNIESWEYDSSLLQANKWQAARHGLHGSFVDPKLLTGQERLPMKEALYWLFEKLRPMSLRLGCEDYLHRCERLIEEDTAAMRLRSLYGETGSFGDTLKTLIGDFWE